MRMQSGMPMPWYALPARYKPGNLRQPRFQFGLARRMSHRVLRHGARPAGNAREPRDAPSLRRSRAIPRSPPRSPRRRSRPALPRRPCRRGSSAPPPCPPVRDTRTSCRPRCRPPGAAAPSWVPGSRTRKAAAQSPPRRTPPPPSSTNCTPPFPSVPPGANPPARAVPRRYAPRTPPPVDRPPATRRPRAGGIRRPSAPPSPRAPGAP